MDANTELTELAQAIGMSSFIEVKTHWNVVKMPNIPPIFTVIEIRDFVEKEFKLRVFPTQKTNGHYGFDLYQKNPVDPIARPFVRVCGNNAYTHNYDTFEKAIEGGLIFTIKNYIL